MSRFFRFPHTPHLVWLGAGVPRDDKVLDPAAVESLLAGPVVVEEKVDGANLGFSTSEGGELRVQNRGAYLSPERCHAQFRTLWTWLAARSEAIVDVLWPDLMLFGEWCFAEHSVAYTRLPDWYLGFDVFDRAAGTFYDTSRRDAALLAAGLTGVPRLGHGIYTVESLVNELGPSRVGDARMEGLVVRRESAGLTSARAKLVRSSFTQSIDEHWSRGRLKRNALAIELAPSPA